MKNAKDLAPDEPGLWDRIGEAFGKMVDDIKDLAQKTWQWVKDHADLIKKIGDVLSKVSEVLTVIAVATSWIPGVGEVMAAAALGTSAAALAAHGLAKAAGADVSWGSIAGDALGVIPGGKVVKEGMSVAKDAAKEFGTGVAKSGWKAVTGDGTKALTEGTKDAFKELKSSAGQLIKDPASTTAHHAMKDYNDMSKSLSSATKALGISRPFAQNTVGGATAIAGYSAAKDLAIGTGVDYGKDKLNEALSGGGGSPSPVVKTGIDQAGGVVEDKSGDALDKGLDKAGDVFAKHLSRR